jgi:hypothetical protein
MQPHRDFVYAGASLQLTAIARDDAGSVVPSPAITWRRARMRSTSPWPEDRPSRDVPRIGDKPDRIVVHRRHLGEHDERGVLRRFRREDRRRLQSADVGARSPGPALRAHVGRPAGYGELRPARGIHANVVRTPRGDPQIVGWTLRADVARSHQDRHAYRDDAGLGVLGYGGVLHGSGMDDGSINDLDVVVNCWSPNGTPTDSRFALALIE